MSSINTNNVSNPIKTYEGGIAKRINPEQQLRRSVVCCLLWENNAYEDGVKIADRIIELVGKVDPSVVKNIAIEARNVHKLRHVPLLIAYAMTKHDTHKGLVSDTLYEVIQRPDELTEYVAIYFNDGGRRGLSAQSRKGLARAFTKFNEYQLAKYNREKAVKLRDVLFLCHSKPNDGVKGYTAKARKKGTQLPPNDEGSKLYHKLVNNQLQIPDTWEVSLSGGEDKKKAWTRLIKDKKLGAMAFLRNLRNMLESKVDQNIIFEYMENLNIDKVLPFRFISAAKAVPGWEDKLETLMLKALNNFNKIPGKTILLVDVSASMTFSTISEKSDLTPLDCACSLAILVREIFDNVEIFTFSYDLTQMPPRRGFALRDVINRQNRRGTHLGASVKYINDHINYERLIVFTDEQSHDAVSNPKGKGYMVNISTNKHGVGYGKWIHIDGFSESVINYIAEYENVKDT